MKADRIRVLIVSDHLGHSEGRIHGATSYFLSVLPLIDRNRFDVTLCFLRGRHAAAQRLEEAGLPPLFLNRGKWDPRAAGDLVRIIRARDIGLVHAAGMKGILSGAWAARRSGVKALAHLHDLVPQPLPIRWLQRLCASWTDRTLVISDAVGRFAVEAFGLPSDRVQTLYNGVDLSRFVPLPPERRGALRAALELPTEAPVLLSIGRLDPVKNQADTIRIVRLVADACPAARLLLIGAGETEAALKSLVRDLHLTENVLFLGQRTDIPELLGVGDLLLITSRSEGLGLAALEALAAGVPVVAVRVGGLPEIIEHERCGCLVPRGDLRAAADAVLRLLGNPVLRQRYARAARERAAHFDLAGHVRRLEMIYRQVARENA